MIKYRAELTFELEWGGLTIRDKRELKEYVSAALETWGGQRNPEDWLFSGLHNPRIKNLRMNTKRQVPAAGLKDL